MPGDALAAVDVERLGDSLVGPQREENRLYQIIDIQQVARPAARLLWQRPRACEQSLCEFNGPALAEGTVHDTRPEDDEREPTSDVFGARPFGRDF